MVVKELLSGIVFNRKFCAATVVELPSFIVHNNNDLAFPIPERVSCCNGELLRSKETPLNLLPGKLAVHGRRVFTRLH